ncbi:MAG: SIS domain-containing protein [Planctomycetota bacterium]
MVDLTMLQEIREQPEVLSRLLRRCQELVRTTAPPGGHLHFTGSGDTYFAALVTEWLARLVWGREVRAWRSMDLRWMAATLAPADRVVCGSVSGRTRRTLEAARLARAKGALVIGVTDDPSSPLAREVDEVLVLGTSAPDSLLREVYAGYEHLVPQTKTYTALLLAELLLAAPDAAAARTLDAIPQAVAEALGKIAGPVEQTAGRCFEGRDEVVILGSGPFLPTAMYGAAKMLEYAIPALAQCLEEYNHLQVFVAGEKTLVVHLAPDLMSASRVAELTGAWDRLGVRSLVVGPEHVGIASPGASPAFPGEGTERLVVPSGSSLEMPFILALVLQMLALYGARRLGRRVNEWLGGRRSDLIQEISLATIRASLLWEGSPRDEAPRGALRSRGA